LSLFNLLFIPFALQGLAMIYDEFYFHRKRGLPKWERIGHPLDTLTVLISFVFLNLYEPNSKNLFIFVLLAAFSCFFVTKDESVHLKHCCAKETWLHAILFILHPIIFVCAGMIWYFQILELKSILSMQMHVILIFLVYQILYWNFYAKK